MRNSVLPILGMLALSLACLWLIPDGTGDGAEGPQVQSGILRLPKDKKKLITSANVDMENFILSESSGQSLPGIEGGRWRVVGIALDDNKPLTRAIALGLGERITELGGVAVFDLHEAPALPTPPDRIFRITTVEGGTPTEHGELNGIVQVHQQEVRLPPTHPAAGLMEAPLVQDITLRLEHRSKPLPGVAWPARWAAIGRGLTETVLTQWDVSSHRLVGGEGLTGLERIESAAPEITPLPASQTQAPAVLSMAGHVIGSERLPEDWDRLRPVAPVGRMIPYDWWQPSRLWFLLVVPLFLVVRLTATLRLPAGHRSRRGWRQWRPWIIAAALTVMVIISAGPHRIQPTAKDVPLQSWAGHLPLPPNLAVLRWTGCFEQELVRGWVGRIQGLTTTDRMGGEIPALQPLLKLLAKKTADPETGGSDDGLWRKQAATDPQATLFARTRGGLDEFIMAIPDAEGWDCVLWQEQPRANSLHQTWLDLASDPEEDPLLVRLARGKLRRHLLTPRIPEDQQAEALKVLRQNPDAAEVAMIAELPSAMAGEDQAAALAKWVLGRASRPESAGGSWTHFDPGDQVIVDGRPFLFTVGDGAGLALISPNQRGELIVRVGDFVQAAPISSQAETTVHGAGLPTVVLTPIALTGVVTHPTAKPSDFRLEVR